MRRNARNWNHLHSERAGLPLCRKGSCSCSRTLWYSLEFVFKSLVFGQLNGFSGCADQGAVLANGTYGGPFDTKFYYCDQVKGTNVEIHSEHLKRFHIFNIHSVIVTLFDRRVLW